MLPISVAGQPLFILRNEVRQVSAFHNVCRHRNLQLDDQPSNCGRLLRCPYHSWSYDLNGALKNAPFFAGDEKQRVDGFKLDQNGLMPVNCAVWHDWVFVNLDPQPETFEDFVLGTYAPDQIGVHLNVPVDAGTTSQLRVIYLHQDTRYSESEIEDLKGLWQEVHREDHAMCERLQTGRHSQLSAQGGVLSPYWETSVRKFQELVADAIRPGLARK